MSLAVGKTLELSRLEEVERHAQEIAGVALVQHQRAQIHLFQTVTAAPSPRHASKAPAKSDPEATWNKDSRRVATARIPS